MKKFIAGLLVGIITMSTFAVFAETTQNINAIFGLVKLIVDGVPVNQETLLHNNTTYIPLRAAAEILGMDVGWNDETRTASLTRGNQSSPTTTAAAPAAPTPATARTSAGPREVSRSGNFKTFELYVNEYSKESYETITGNTFTRRITFEIPVEWDDIGTTVFGIQDADFYNIFKVDMWHIIRASREDIINNHRDYRSIDNEIVESTTYSTDKYEVFYYKSLGEVSVNHTYYLFANGEYFVLSGYDFTDSNNTAMFKRIAESVIFQ